MRHYKAVYCRALSDMLIGITSMLASSSRYRIDQIDVLLSDAAEALTISSFDAWNIQQTGAVSQTRASKWKSGVANVERCA